MSSTIGAPQQHKQPSRKGKRAWRKNVDITEVQAGLEVLREEITQGGPVAEKPSEELFAVDTTGSDDIKRKFKLQKPLKADEILARRSAVPAVDSRKRPHSKITDGVVELSSKRQKTDWISKKEVQRLKDSLHDHSRLSVTQVAEEEEKSSGFDLWAPNDSSSAVVGNERREDYVPKPRTKVAPLTLRRAPIAMTTNGKPVPAVTRPDAGTSYNPSFEDWDDLLTREGQKEVEAEQARLRHAQIEAEREARIQAMAEAETDDRGEESTWEGFDTDQDEAGTLGRKPPRRKTPAERNKIKRRKEAERLAKHEKNTADRRRQAAQMEALLNQMIEADQSAAAELVPSDQTQEEIGDDTRLRRKRLGNMAIPEKRLEVVLPDELQDSLRRLKPEGNLLNDRFRNLLVNGKIESRKPVWQPRKKKRTVTEKWAYKDFSISV